MAITKVSTGMKTAPTSAEVTAHVTAFDDKDVRNDIATLALHSAIADNKAAHNLSNSFIDQYEDGTGIDVHTSTSVSSTEYISTLAPGSASAITIDVQGNANHVTRKAKFGTSSIECNATSGFLRWTDATRFEYGSADFTIEFWANLDSFVAWQTLWAQRQSAYPPNSPTATSGTYIDWIGDSDGDLYRRNKSITMVSDETNVNIVTSGTIIDTWRHYAIVRNGTKVDSYCDGTALSNQQTASGAIATNLDYMALGQHQDCCFDDFRVSNTARYPTGSNFTTPTRLSTDSNTLFLLQSINQTNGGTTFADTGPGVTNATGNYTSTTQTSVASVSSMGIVVLYKDNAGTATLNTDLVAAVSADGGSNYSTATLVAGGTFSTGIKIAAVSGVSVTAGTTPKYKISFANQADGSKDTQVHGVALLY